MLDLVQEMQEREVSLDAGTYAFAMHACRATGQWTQCLALLEGLRRVPPPSLFEDEEEDVEYDEDDNPHDLVEEGSLDAVEAEVREVDGPVRLLAYNRAMSCLQRAGQWKLTIDLLDELIAHPTLKPDQKAFTTAMWACEQGGQWERAAELLEDMRYKHRIDTTRQTYLATISACEKAGEHDRAVFLLGRAAKLWLFMDLFDTSGVYHVHQFPLAVARTAIRLASATGAHTNLDNPS
mmetsp:Transcript_5787/g.24156  ORF Transcript_5787/g.24156 Transcript_5787/m.24156 type:complete len:237 (+) Transcript_5787:672-1382(+)